MLLLLLASCSDPEPSTVYGKSDTGSVASSSSTDTDADTDADTDTDSDSDTDSDTDTTTTTPWMGDDDSVTPIGGIDVSHWNGTINWSKVYSDGYRFMIAKATEGDYYTDNQFSANYDGAYQAGVVRGAYHFATPNDTDGATQAEYFVDHGGGWSADGLTLPGVLDIEYNPYGNTCYDLSKSEMAAWVEDFVDTYQSLTGRYPVIYTNANWWNSCVGTSTIPNKIEIWVAHWGAQTPTLPSGWATYTFWQYSATGTVSGISGDTDLSWFPGTMHDLRMFALNQ